MFLTKCKSKIEEKPGLVETPQNDKNIAAKTPSKNKLNISSIKANIDRVLLKATDREISSTIIATEAKQYSNPFVIQNLYNSKDDEATGYETMF